MLQINNLLKLTCIHFKNNNNILYILHPINFNPLLIYDYSLNTKDKIIIVNNLIIRLHILYQYIISIKIKNNAINLIQYAQKTKKFLCISILIYKDKSKKVLTLQNIAAIAIHKHLNTFDNNKIKKLNLPIFLYDEILKPKIHLEVLYYQNLLINPNHPNYCILCNIKGNILTNIKIFTNNSFKSFVWLK